MGAWKRYMAGAMKLKAPFSIWESGVITTGRRNFMGSLRRPATSAYSSSAKEARRSAADRDSLGKMMVKCSVRMEYNCRGGENRSCALRFCMGRI
jgi:hypothetical protein